MNGEPIVTVNRVNWHVTNDPFYAENGYVFYLNDAGPCWIVDPGLPPQASEMLAFMDARHLTPDAIVLTHAHADHIAGIDELLAVLGQLPVYLAQPEWPMLADPRKNLSAGFGVPISAHPDEIRDLPVGGTIQLGPTAWEIGDVAGHSPAGRSMYCAEHGVAIVGDALFAGSVGRVDLPGGDGAKLIRNIRQTLLTLPDETRILSGHGPETTIAHERTTNPYLLHGL
ncbi:MAG: MBL fold metallo-hydrolase [Phycisphaerales bacterium]|nr:MBL fold metallo-hydrolase [Phycisphaerales bacterium]